MRLTRKKSIELCIELWEWLAETGGYKEDWPKWKEYGTISNYCWFCEYDTRRSLGEGHCNHCPFEKQYGHCNTITEVSYYPKWIKAKFSRTRKKYAKLFLEQIKELK